jgi:hypothetical protein
MYTFVNSELRKEANKLISKGWSPIKGKISGNSIEFDEDCSSYLYYSNVIDRDSDLFELERILKEKLVN